ncbi:MULTISPECIES: macrolide family glycosyltransferase [unclassified Streptomyces]|uniref:macrolide family glycosyltransferase n=1 Tax=unclassified Streptomyces TaxID=2593676 RepID=UPI0011CE00E1|nr:MULTISPECIES: macrolide family glycosyltransferase [unclassified Streptomyces]TXS80463.1 glycosyl transferase [Streptomyces sp. me109]
MPHPADPRPLHCAVLPFADFGHVAPSLGVARALVAGGHRVTYVVDERYASLVEEAGARAVTYTSARGEFYRAADPAPGQLAAEGYALLVDTIETVFPAALTALAQDPPDAVLYDFENVAAGRVAARVLGALPVQMFPSHAANETFSLRAQMWDRADPVMAKGAGVLIEFMGEHGIGLDEMSRYGTEWDEHNLVFLPRDFQIEGDTFDDRFAFVGPMVTEAPAGLWSPPADGRRTALVSLGTESGDRGDFFRTCAQAFDPASWHVVMTLGHGADHAQLGPLPPHVEIHDWLPHPAVLPHADVLVCHAGMGSLMEALYFATPVVAIPRAHELGLSAERLEQCGVGRTLSRTGLDAQVLARTVNGLLADPRTPGALRRMREAVRGAGGAVRAADTLQGWAARHRRHRTGGPAGISGAA